MLGAIATTTGRLTAPGGKLAPACRSPVATVCVSVDGPITATTPAGPKAPAGISDANPT